VRVAVDDLLQHVDEKDEEVRGQRIPLARAAFACEPRPRGPIHQDNRF
jgi:hypothetical protein